MDNIYIKMCIGIGDLLFYSSILSEYKHKYRKAIICPDLELLDLVDSEKRNDYIKFIEDFCNIIFKDDFFFIDYKLKDRRLDPNEMCSAYGFNPCLKDFRKDLCSDFSLNLENYVVITTKSRSFGKKIYEEKIRSVFIDLLKKISNKYKIVLMGEREIGKHWEYAFHDVFSLYFDIINSIPPNCIIDITEKEFQTVPPRIGKLMDDCSVAKGARCVINIGGGGGIVLSLCCAKVINISTFSECGNFSKAVAKNELKKGNFVLSDVNDFIFHINNI